MNISFAGLKSFSSFSISGPVSDHSLLKTFFSEVFQQLVAGFKLFFQTCLNTCFSHASTRVSDVTVLLSLTVFLNTVSETMPNTSDAVPLISMYRRRRWRGAARVLMTNYRTLRGCSTTMASYCGFYMYSFFCLSYKNCNESFFYAPVQIGRDKLGENGFMDFELNLQAYLNRFNETVVSNSLRDIEKRKVTIRMHNRLLLTFLNTKKNIKKLILLCPGIFTLV